MSFNKFKEIFDNTYNNIYLFVNEEEGKYEGITCPFKYKLIENLDNENYDSHGYEDTDLKRVYFIEDYDIHVAFLGNRSSYQGEEWYEYKEVNKKEKTITTWE